MKKNISYLLFFVVFALLFTNCEKDNIIEPIQSIEKENPIKIKTLRLSEIPQVRDFLTDKTNGNLFKSTEIDGAIFDEDHIMEVIDTLAHTNYSFRFTYLSTPVGTFYNLIVGKTPEGEHKTPYVLKYTCDNASLDEYIAHNYDFRFFKGKVAIHRYTDFFGIGSIFKGGDTCPPVLDENGNPVPCLENTLGGGSATVGGGNGDTGSIGEPDYNGSGGSNEDPDSNGSCNYLIIYDVSHDPEICGPAVYSCSYVAAVIEFCGSKSLSAKNGEDCECLTPIGVVGVNADEMSHEIFIEEQIIDNNLDPCSKGILTQLKNLQSNDIATVLNRFGNPSSKYNWEIKTGTPSVASNAAETDWSRDSQGSAIDYNYVTNISPSYKNSATKLSIARTILHEALHTYLISLVDDVVLTGSTDVTNFPLLWNALVNQTYDNNPNALHHEIIGRSFVDPLKDAIKEYDNATHSDQFYEDIAWGALENTSTFNALFPTGSSDRARVINTNKAEDTNTTQGNISPKGNPC